MNLAMEKCYRYHLLKYSGPASRLRCPGCGRPHCFTPYVDENGVPADVERYGRCDHESSCGYCAYPPPSEHFPHGEYVSAVRKFRKRPLNVAPHGEATPCTIPEEIVRRTVVFTSKNAFIAFLLRQFPEATVRRLVEQYRIGTTRDGHTIFYQIDAQGRVRSGKIIPYNPETGHRIKDGSVPAAAWVHTRLKALHQLPDDWTLTQCLFGEHLLPLFPASIVALVESEKTAVICAAAFPDCIWLATGGKSQLGSKLSVLRGRHVIAFPDTDAYPACTTSSHPSASTSPTSSSASPPMKKKRKRLTLRIGCCYREKKMTFNLSGKHFFCRFVKESKQDRYNGTETSITTV